MTLSAEETALAAECLLNTASSRIYEDWEFQTLMGVDRDEMRQAATLMRQGNVAESGWVALNTLAHLFGYPHPEANRRAFISTLAVDEVTIRALQDKLSKIPFPSKFL